MSQVRSYDAIIIGAGAAGLMCAIEAGRRDRSVLIIDHANKVGNKILISGGGHCNFTNWGAEPADYQSDNPQFCISALSRYTPKDFLTKVESHNIPYHEKTLGQLFCDGSSTEILNMLTTEAMDAAVTTMDDKVVHVRRQPGRTAIQRMALADAPQVYFQLGIFEVDGAVLLVQLHPLASDRCSGMLDLLAVRHASFPPIESPGS